MSTSGPRPNSKDSRSEEISMQVEGIVSTLRAGVYLGEAHNAVWLFRAGDSGILGVIGSVKPNTPASAQVKNVASSSKSIQEILRPLLPPTLTLEIQPTTGPPSSNKLTQPKSASGNMKPLANSNTRLPAQQLPPQHHGFYLQNRRSAPLQRASALALLSRTASQTPTSSENSP